MNPLMISIKDFCALCGVGRTKCWSMIRAGEIEAIHIGRRRLILMASVEKLIVNSRTASEHR